MQKRRTYYLIIFIILLAALPAIYYYKNSSVYKKDSPQSLPNINQEPKISRNSDVERIKPQTTSIIIDPGHGGEDSGTEKDQVIESKVTLDIAKKLKNILEDKQHYVDMTRNEDISLYKLSNVKGNVQKRELDARTNIINKSGAKLFASIHVDSYPKHPEMSGSIVYYNPEMPYSKELANCIQKRINELNFERDTHDPREANFYLLKNSDIPGVLIETAFITNQTDFQLLQQEDFKLKLAEAVSTGIDDFIKFKPEFNTSVNISDPTAVME